MARDKSPRGPRPASRGGRKIEPGVDASGHSRIACVDIPALPLQLLLAEQPDWRGQPVVVVDDDSPQGKVLWVNRVARTQRILPGMRYAAAQSLVATLRARVVPPPRVEQAVGHIFAVLHGHSPRVEPDTRQPGVFFLDPSGLERLHGSLEQWTRDLRQSLAGRDFVATVVVGFHRFRCFAIARSTRGCLVLPSPRREANMAATVSLEQIGISTRLRDELSTLGLRTLGDFVTLPPAELRLRYGEEAEALHHAATGVAWDPLAPRELVDPVRQRIHFEPPEGDHPRLLFRIKSKLEALMQQLSERGLALSALRIDFELDHAGQHREQLEPAAPTLDVMQMLELIRLRVGALQLPAPIEALTLDAEGLSAEQHQLRLFEMQRRRDLDAGARALARLEALFGAGTVTRARTVAAHLPEASYTWESVSRLRLPRARESLPASAQDGEDLPPLCRRLFARPIAIGGPRRVRNEGWELPPYGTIVALHGPFRVSGGWWVRTVERDYYYAETRGEAGHETALVWIYYDRPRRRWYLHGEVD